MTKPVVCRCGETLTEANVADHVDCAVVKVACEYDEDRLRESLGNWEVDDV